MTRDKEREEREWREWRESLTPEERRQRAARHQGGPDPVRIIYSLADDARRTREIEGRRGIAESFDLVEFEWYYSLSPLIHTVLRIRAEGDGLRITRTLEPEVFAPDDAKEETLELHGEDARTIRESFEEMRSHEWLSSFEPNGLVVLDGYDWTLKVAHGTDQYQCSGENAQPDELLQFLASIEQQGLHVGFRE